MSLSDALKAQEPQTEPCKFALVVRQLSEEDQKVLKAAFADRTVPSRRIARALTIEGHAISHSTVQQHRASTCRCFRTPVYR